MKKAVVFFLSCALLAGMLAGCGSADGQKSTESGKSGTEKEEVTLRFLAYETGAEAVREAVAPFMEANPNIKVEVVAATDFTAMNQNAIAAHQANDDYDVMFVNHVDTLAYVQGDIIQPIDEYIKNDKIDYSTILFESLLEQGQADGVTYTVPVNTGTRVLAVNKDLFEKYNLEYPETMEDMLKAAEILTQDGNYGFVSPLTENCYTPTYEMGIFLAASGGKLYEMENGKAIAKIDTPEMKEYLHFVMNMLPYMPKDSLTMTGDDARKAFASGNVGMYKFGNWEYELLPETTFEYELIKVPAGSGGHTSTNGGFQLGIGSGSKHPDEAWELVKYLTTTQEAMSALAGTDLPTMMECYEVEPYNDPKYDIFNEQLEDAYLTGIPVPNMNAVSEEFFRYWNDMLYQKISVDDMCAEAQEAVQKLLDESNK